MCWECTGNVESLRYQGDPPKQALGADILAASQVRRCRCRVPAQAHPPYVPQLVLNTLLESALLALMALFSHQMVRPAMPAWLRMQIEESVLSLD